MILITSSVFMNRKDNEPGHTKKNPREKMSSTGILSLSDMLMPQSVGMMITKMARSEDILKTAWMTSKRK